MSDLTSILESILFVASKPLTVASLARALDVEAAKIETSIEQLREKYTGVSGIHLVSTENEVQLSTNPENSSEVEKFVAKDILGELTKAQLETLTIIAYRGPVTRAEIEEIRGVNSVVILRTLLIRDLVKEHENSDSVLPSYTISITALRHLGVAEVSELPEYTELSLHPHFESHVASDEKDSV